MSKAAGSGGAGAVSDLRREGVVLDGEGARDGVAGAARAVVGEALALEVTRPLQLPLQ